MLRPIYLYLYQRGLLCQITNFKEYLDDEFGRILPENQNKYRELFKRLGFGKINHDFVEFWSTYSDEIYGKLDIWLICQWTQRIFQAAKQKF